MDRKAPSAARSEKVRETASRKRPAINAHVRLSGIIRIGARTAMLEADDGEIWRVQADDPLDAYAEQRVKVEARVGGADVLTLLWIGPEDTGSDA